MKILKFGGTSVGKPERMHQVADLITRDSGRKIVVLSALSGTTNTLVDIGAYLFDKNREGAIKLIETLYTHYQEFIGGLLASEENQTEATRIIDQHFGFIKSLSGMFFNNRLKIFLVKSYSKCFELFNR